MTRAVWFELYVTDLDDAQRFYGAVLGWQLEPFEAYDPENYFLLRDTDGAPVGGAIVRRGSVPGLGHTGSGQSVIYLRVADLDATLDRVEDAGGTVLTCRRTIGVDDGDFALVADPEGNAVGIWTPN